MTRTEAGYRNVVWGVDDNDPRSENVVWGVNGGDSDMENVVWGVDAITSSDGDGDATTDNRM